MLNDLIAEAERRFPRLHGVTRFRYGTRSNSVGGIFYCCSSFGAFWNVRTKQMMKQFGLPCSGL